MKVKQKDEWDEHEDEKVTETNSTHSIIILLCIKPKIEEPVRPLSHSTEREKSAAICQSHLV